MNLAQWLDYISSIHRTEIDLGLERIRRVAVTLNITSFSCPVITVAGTNGKGSCVATIAAIARQAGYIVATYTSPHLLIFNERIQINGQPVTDDLINNAFAQIESARGEISLTYFEFVTLAALLIFKQAKLDLLILEVGLGGRLDAVNIIDPDIAVITTIALDHMDRLGSTRELIGYEKAGILRPGKPAVCGDYDIPGSIMEKADLLKVQLFRIGHEFNLRHDADSWNWQSQTVNYSGLPLPQLELQNVATAIQALQLLSAVLPISARDLKQALKGLSLLGRFSQLFDKVPLIVDVAHNPAGGALLAKNLNQTATYKRTLAVVGMLGDKDCKATLAPLIGIISKWFVGSLHVPRGAQAKHLADCLTAINQPAPSSHKSVVEAYQAACNEAEEGDRIVVLGSFHTVGEILSYLQGAQVETHI